MSFCYYILALSQQSYLKCYNLNLHQPKMFSQLSQFISQYSESVKQVDEGSIRIIEICGQFQLDRKEGFNLYQISSRIPCSTYNPSKNGAIIFRRSNPKATILLYPRGNGFIHGTTTQYDMEYVAKKVARLISSIMSQQIKLKHVRVQNMSAIANLGFKVNFALLAQDSNSTAVYSNSGLAYKLELSLQRKCLVRKSGKITLQKRKNLQCIEQTLKEAKRQLKKYELKDNLCQITTYLQEAARQR